MIKLIMMVLNVVGYIKRIIDDDLKCYLKIKGVVLLTGPKWCGKITTAQQQANSSLKLDDIDKNVQYYIWSF